MVNYYGHSKLLRRSIFNTAGSFGNVLSCAVLSGRVSCESAAVWIWIRIVRCERPAKRQKSQDRQPPLTLVRGLAYRGRVVAKTRAISRCDSCDSEFPRFVCSRSTRETHGIAAKLSRCRIASESLWRNMPLRCCFPPPPSKPIVADSPLLLEIQALEGRRKPQKTTAFH